MNGKGDKQRPRMVSRGEYEANWDAVFGKKATSGGAGADPVGADPAEDGSDRADSTAPADHKEHESI